MLVRPGQSWNAPHPILVTESGIVMSVRRVQWLKAIFPISVTELGIVTLVRSEHLEKAMSPILVMELGIVTLVSWMQCANAYSSISVTVYDFPFCEIVAGMVTAPAVVSGHLLTAKVRLMGLITLYSKPL